MAGIAWLHVAQKRIILPRYSANLMRYAFNVYGVSTASKSHAKRRIKTVFLRSMYGTAAPPNANPASVGFFIFWLIS